MALVRSRAICTVLFLMAELCRRPLPKLGGLIVRTFLRGYLWASPFFFFFFFFFFFVDVGNRTNVFFVQEHVLAKFGALRARSFNSRDRSL